MAIAINPRRELLLKKAEALPMRPGVYIMKDEREKIIYVGKSKKLRNRVSQYFMNGEKTRKTARMVSRVFDFDYILCDTEIESLALENTLIKKHTPRYNIKLKDSRSYPYIKMTAEEYPKFEFTRSRLSDKATYFGPYTGTGVASSLLTVVNKVIGIPSCNRRFPQDIGKGRPCIYYEMNKCCGLCTGKVTKEEYLSLCRLASSVLKGNTAGVISDLEKRMLDYAEKEMFEAAITARDAISALRKIEKDQKVVADPDESLDCVAFCRGERLSGVSVFIVRNGALTDKREFVFGADGILDESSVITFLCSLYCSAEDVPPSVLLAFETDEQMLFSEYLSKIAGRRVEVRTPIKGRKQKLCEMVSDNIKEKITDAERKSFSADELLASLAETIGLDVLPSRIEAWDISNLSYENITAGMIVITDAEFCKKDYRIFKIKEVKDAPDDYSSMREAISRRFAHLSDEEGSFSELPDLILLDGGKGHVSTVRALLSEIGISIPVFGMVKDDKHRTRALCTEDGEIAISENRSVFNFIYKIQEEVHRFTVSRMMGSKLKTLKTSVLCEIDGIGEAKTKKLLEAFGSIADMKAATEEELASVKGISARDAKNIFAKLHEGEGI